VTARARFMTTSEYLRQALLKSLKDDGAVCPSLLVLRRSEVQCD
jgi:hypothetical protein